MGEYYRGQYRKEHPILDKYARKRAEFIIGKVSWGGTLLDVGCGSGSLLKDRWEGVEPDLGTEGVYRDIDEVKKHYDWLVCSHVIEHVADPVGFMEKMKKLADEFLFIVPVSNYGEPHLYAFSERGFDIVVRKAGFEIKESGFETGVGYWTLCTK